MVFMSCRFVYVQRGASNSKFLNYINKHLLPVFDKVLFSVGSGRAFSECVCDENNAEIYSKISAGKFFIYFWVGVQLPEDKKLDLLKNLAESSPYTSPQDARQLLPSILQLFKVL